MDGTNDWDLVQAYAKSGSETAFAELVRRHIDWVYSVALRQTRNPQLSEDVVQSAFALLAHKAAGLRPGVIVSGWLFRSTCFLAKCALRAEQRRKAREEAAAQMSLTNQTDDDLLWQDLTPFLDQAVASLSEADRTAILARFYEKKTLPEVSRRLGISEEAAKKRVSRALEKLKTLLGRRGVTLSGLVLGTLLAERTVQAAPGALLATITSAPVATSVSLPALAKEALQWSRRTTLKLVSAVTCSIILLGVLSRQAALHYRLGFSQSGPSKGAEAVIPPATMNTAGDGKSAFNTNGANVTDGPAFVLRVVAADDGHGLASARILYNEVTGSEWHRGKDLKTDADGFCTVPLEADLGRLDVGALKDGFVQMFYTWRAELGGPLPRLYILKLGRATGIGGHVQNSAGKPVGSASIVVAFSGTGDATAREPVSERLGFIVDTAVATTDSQGNWHCAITPPGYEDFSISVQHPQYVRKSYRVSSDSDKALSPADLWAGKALMVLEPGFQVRGFVLDSAEHPLPGARVSLMGGMKYVQEGERTGPDGSFSMSSLAPGPAKLSAWSKGLAPSLLTVDIKVQTPSVVFRLNTGTQCPIRIVDQDDEPIAGAWAAMDLPVQHNADLRVVTGPDGRANFVGIPTNATGGLVVHAGAKGYFYARDIPVNPAEPETIIQLKKALRVTGSVSDAETHEPVPDFKAIPCYGEEAGGYDRSQTKHGEFGSYTVEFSEWRLPFRVRIEAEDYEPATSGPIPAEPAEQQQDFLLRKQDKSRNLTGQVLTAAGEPAANVEVALLTFEQGASLLRGVLKPGDGAILTRTDARGEFTFSPDAQAHTIVAADPAAGFARLRLHHAAAPYKLQLGPWGRVEGKLLLSGKAAANREMWVTQGFPAYRSVRELLYANAQTTTDSAGRFSFETIAPGDYTLFVNEAPGRPFSHSRPVVVSAGQTTTVNVSGGVQVTGSLVVKDGRKVDWPAQVSLASLTTSMKPPFQAPPEPHDLAGRLELLDFFDHSAEWRAYETASGSFPLEVGPDGRFSVEDVRPGNYKLSVTLSEAGAAGEDILARMRRRALASLDKEVVISAQTSENQIVELGTLELVPK